ncbi:ComEC family competence protein [mine drainage metagenome]|uniref:ComEC family competence protein n=1 Tax=mine drainage metagenome TaxID=410659 RepID=A0A1J5SSR9_9ZZZZ
MVFAALMFVLGAWTVQQLAQLPSLTWLCTATFALVPIFLSLYHLRCSIAFVNFRYFLRPLLMGIAAFLFGICWASGFAMWRMSDELPHLWEQKTIEVVGVVASVPEATERGERFRFDTEEILTPDVVVPKHISLNQYRGNYLAGARHAQTLAPVLTPYSRFHAGERWKLLVRLKRPHGTQNPHGFDFEAWALSENIRAMGSINSGHKSAGANVRLSDFVWQPKYVVERLREKVRQRIASVLVGKPLAGVIQALVIGDDSQINQADWQVFLRTGTSHLMSISGLHITMLAGLAFGLVAFFWRRIPMLALRLPTRKAATVVGVITAVCYALIAGFSVPSQRTFYMLLVFAVALWSGRQLVISQVLAMALCIVVLLDPWAVSAPGFWLSFGAVAILAYALGARIGQPHWFTAAVQTQWAVTIGMLPLLLVMFNQTSIVSPVANAFAIPMISFLVTPLALLGSFLPFDAPLHLSYQVLQICMAALKWLNQLPMSTWQQHDPAVWTLLPAIVGVLWLLLPLGFPLRWLGWVGFLPMIFITPVRPLVGDMKVTVLDVGQGLSVVVQTEKHTLLYDAGPIYNAQSDAGSHIVVPFLRGEGVKKLDGFIVSHNDNDHSGGMNSVFAQMSVGWFASSLPESSTVLKTAQSMRCYAGQRWSWDGVSFEVLYPELESYDDATIKDNNRSCVVKVTSQSGSLLLTGDIEKSAEMTLLNISADKLMSNVIVAPHHGSKTSSSIGFISAVNPSVNVFTTGYLNRFKHPAPEVVARYQDMNSIMYRSDYHGALTLHFVDDPLRQHEINVTSWRSQHKRYWHDSISQ